MVANSTTTNVNLIGISPSYTHLTRTHQHINVINGSPNALIFYGNNSVTESINTDTTPTMTNTALINNSSTVLDQYGLQLYNCALNIANMRGPPYTAAAIAAATLHHNSTASCTRTADLNHYNENTNNSNRRHILNSSYLEAPSTVMRTGTRPISSRFTLASMALFPSQRVFQSEEPKPQHSYIGLIAIAILNSTESKLVLSDIYQYILDNYPYFRSRGPGWRNSIRHNLSLNDCFIKSGRSANGKGHYWAIHPANIDDFRKGDFRRRKAQRKVRKHMGLTVDDVSTDSPSPPIAMDLTGPTSPTPTFMPLQLLPPIAPFHAVTSIGIAPLSAQQLAAHAFDYLNHNHNHQHQQQEQRCSQFHPPYHSIMHQHTAYHTLHHSAQTAHYIDQMFVQRPIETEIGTIKSLSRNNSNNNNDKIDTTAQQEQNKQQQEGEKEHFFREHTCLTASDIHHSDYLLQANKSTISNPASSPILQVIDDEIYSQTRKRQFDVASLLAPDNAVQSNQHNRKPLETSNSDFDTEFCSRLSSNKCAHLSSHSIANTLCPKKINSRNEHELEDIDVVDDISNDEINDIGHLDFMKNNRHEIIDFHSNTEIKKIEENNGLHTNIVHTTVKLSKKKLSPSTQSICKHFDTIAALALKVKYNVDNEDHRSTEHNEINLNSLDVDNQSKICSAYHNNIESDNIDNINNGINVTIHQHNRDIAEVLNIAPRFQNICSTQEITTMTTTHTNSNNNNNNRNITNLNNKKSNEMANIYEDALKPQADIDVTSNNVSNKTLMSPCSLESSTHHLLGHYYSTYMAAAAAAAAATHLTKISYTQ